MNIMPGEVYYKKCSAFRTLLKTKSAGIVYGQWPKCALYEMRVLRKMETMSSDAATVTDIQGVSNREIYPE